MQNVISPTATETVPPEASYLTLFSTPGSSAKCMTQIPHITAAKESCAGCSPGLLLPLKWAQDWLQLWVRANQVKHREGDAHQPSQAASQTSRHMLASQCCFNLHPNPSCWSLECPASLMFALIPPLLHLLNTLGQPQLLALFSSEAMGTSYHLHILLYPHLAAPLAHRCLGGSICCLALCWLSQHPWFLSFVWPSHPCPFCICCPSQADSFSWFLPFFSLSPLWNTFKGWRSY